MGENGSISENERRFAREMLAGRNLFDNPPTKQEYYFLYKWHNKDWWEYGVSLRGGWLTDKGRERLVASPYCAPDATPAPVTTARQRGA